MSYMLKSPQLAARFSLGNSCEVGFPSKRFAVTCDCPPTSCHAQLLHSLLCSAHAMINAWPSVCHKLIRTSGITKLRGIAGISAKTAQRAPLGPVRPSTSLWGSDCVGEVSWSHTAVAVPRSFRTSLKCKTWSVAHSREIRSLSNAYRFSRCGKHLPNLFYATWVEADLGNQGLA